MPPKTGHADNCACDTRNEPGHLNPVSKRAYCNAVANVLQHLPTLNLTHTGEVADFFREGVGDPVALDVAKRMSSYLNLMNGRVKTRFPNTTDTTIAAYAVGLLIESVEARVRALVAEQKAPGVRFTYRIGAADCGKAEALYDAELTAEDEWAKDKAKEPRADRDQVDKPPKDWPTDPYTGRSRKRPDVARDVQQATLPTTLRFPSYYDTIRLTYQSQRKEQKRKEAEEHDMRLWNTYHGSKAEQAASKKATNAENAAKRLQTENTDLRAQNERLQAENERLRTQLARLIGKTLPPLTDESTALTRAESEGLPPPPSPKDIVGHALEQRAPDERIERTQRPSPQGPTPPATMREVGSSTATNKAAKETIELGSSGSSSSKDTDSDEADGRQSTALPAGASKPLAKASATVPNRPHEGVKQASDVEHRTKRTRLRATIQASTKQGVETASSSQRGDGQTTPKSTAVAAETPKTKETTLKAAAVEPVTPPYVDKTSWDMTWDTDSAKMKDSALLRRSLKKKLA